MENNNSTVIQPSGNTITKLKIFLPYALLLAFFFILGNNSFYGFGWTDEALYLSKVNCISQGNAPFFDIWEPTQFYSLLLLPIYSLSIKILGNTDYIYLVFRIITLFFQYFVAALTFNIFSKRFNRSSILIAVIGLLCFSRACIPGPSYYTIGLYSYVLAIDFIYAVFELKHRSFYLFLSGIFLSFAVLCNPYLVLVYTVGTICLFIFKTTRNELKKFFILYLGIIFSAGLYITVTLKNHSLQDFFRSLSYVLSSPEYSGKSTINTIKWLLKFPRLFITPLFYYFVFTVISLLCIFKNGFRDKFITDKAKAILTTLLFINYFIFVALKKDCGSSIVGFFYLPFFMLFTFSNFSKYDFRNLFEENKKIIFTFIIPGLSLSFMECLCSDTGFGVFSIGMVVCFIGIIPFFFSVLEKIDFTKKKIAATIFILFCISGTLYHRINLVYRDSRLSPHLLFVPKLHKGIAKIDKGPAKGIWTTKANFESYNKIFDDVKNIDYSKGDSIFISKLVPWAYLVNPGLKTNAPTTWRMAFTDFRLKEYYKTEKHDLPTFILLIDESIRDNNNNPVENTWMMDIIENKYNRQEVNCGILYTRKN